MMDQELFIKVMQDIKTADAWFAKRKPWPSDKTHPRYIFFELTYFLSLDDHGFAESVRTNPQLARQWCYLIVRNLPKHLNYVLKLMQKSNNKDLTKKPQAVESEVWKWDGVYEMVKHRNSTRLVSPTRRTHLASNLQYV